MSRRLIPMITLVFLLMITGCGDDPVEPDGGRSEELWTMVDLGLDSGDLRLFSIAARGSHVAAVGWWESPDGGKDLLPGASILFRLLPDGTWSHQSPAPGSASATWMDLALDDLGRDLLRSGELFL